jgi:hypothetical protein
LFPTKEADTDRDVKVTRLETSPGISGTIATALKIELDYGSNGNIGYYYLSHEAAPAAERSFGTFSTDGKAAYVETDCQGNYVKAALKSGTFLKNGTTCLISFPETGDGSL